jgi:hypothetical protein
LPLPLPLHDRDALARREEFLRESSMVVDWRIVETMPPSDPRDAH